LNADGLICSTCHQQLTNYDFFLTDLRTKHEALHTQYHAAKKRKKPVNPRSFDPLSEPDQSENHERNFNGSYEDDDVIVLPTEKPQVFEIDDEEEGSSDDEAHDASENVVVSMDPDAYGSKDSFYHDHGFPAHFLDFAESPSPQRRVREAQCGICLAVFPSIVGLKIHEKKAHKLGGGPGIPSPLPSQPVTLMVKDNFSSPKQSSIPCPNCVMSFKSYYHMQKHRELVHPESVSSFKCSFPYCRTRGNTHEEIEAHYTKFHEGVEPPPPKKRKRRSKKNPEELSE
jgi:hypothetical protein